MKQFLGVLSLFWCGCIQAGVLVLSNGDKLNGQLVRVDDDFLIWKTASFGEQSVKRVNVKSFSTDQALKINGSSSPCLLLKFEHDELTYSCDDAATSLNIPFLTLKVMVPFKDYKSAAVTYRGKLNLYGVYSRGNETRNEWNVQAETDVRHGEFRHVIGGDYYSVSQVRWSARYSFDWFLHERWFWYNNTAIGTDPKRGMEKYTLLGSGVGYQFWETKKATFSLKAGGAYLNESYLPPKQITINFDREDNFFAARAAIDFRYTFPLGVVFTHNNELIQSLEESANWRLKTSSGISSMIMNKVFAEFKFDYSRDNEPQPGRQGVDKRLSLGVSYKW